MTYARSQSASNAFDMARTAQSPTRRPTGLLLYSIHITQNNAVVFLVLVYIIYQPIKIQLAAEIIANYIRIVYTHSAITQSANVIMNQEHIITFLMRKVYKKRQSLEINQTTVILLYFVI